MFRCLNILPYRYLILHKSWADFKADSQRTYLGIAWWVLDPIINTCIFYLIFGVVMRQRIENFVPFLLIGLVMWRWFDASCRGAARSIYANVGFVRQVSFPKIVFPLITIATNSYQFIFSLAILFVTIWLFDIPFTVYSLLFPVVLIVEWLLIVATGLMLGSVVPFIPDLATFFDYMFRVGFYLSGIFYTVSSMHSEWIRTMLRLNPMFVIIESSRDLLMYQRMPDWTALTVIAVISMVFLYLGAFLISRFDLVYAKRIV